MDMKDHFPQSYFEIIRDAVCVVRRGVVVYANPVFRLLFNDNAKGQPIDRLLPEINPYIKEERYVTAVTVDGVTYTVSAMRQEDDLILTLFRQDRSMAGVSPGLLRRMNDAVFSMHLSLERLLPRDTENEDPHTRTLYHSYFSIKHLVDQLSDVAMLSKGEMFCQMQTLDLAGLVRDLTDSVAFFLGKPNVSLTCSVPEEACYVNGDRKKLQQLLLILLNNSLQHTADGDSISVGLRRTARQYILSVDDTGEGMSGDEVAWAFTPREALPLTAVGAGMGLHIAYGLAKLHGGTIILQSEPGKGTRVRLTLPANDSLTLRDAPYTESHRPDQILTELADVLPNDAYHPKYRG